MSINTLSKKESLATFNRHIPGEHIDRLKIISDAKSDTDELTQENTAIKSSHGEAFQKVSNKKSECELKAISAPVDSEDYFNELLKGAL